MGGVPEGRILYLALEGFCHGNLFFGRVKAITKWPGMCLGWGWWGEGPYGEIWGDTGDADMDDRNTRAQVVSTQRRFLGGETGHCRKRGLLSHSAAGPSRVGRVRRVLWPAGEPEAGALGRRKGCRREGSRVSVCWGSLVDRGCGPGEPGLALYSQCREGRRI